MNDVIFNLTLRLAAIENILDREGDAYIGFGYRTMRSEIRDRIAHELWVAQMKASN